MTDPQSRGVTPAELRLDVARRRRESSDPFVFLETERDLAAADRDECHAADDKARANQHAERCDALGAAAEQLKRLREINASMQTVLVNRVIVALKDAKRPAWEATHQHYKGGLYRFLTHAEDNNGEELVQAVVYDDHQGRRFVLSRERWESFLESGTQRYRPIPRTVEVAST